MATESNPLYFDALHNRFLRTPSVEVLGELEDGETQFDTVLCLNQLEGEADPSAVVAAAARNVKPGGNLVLLVQQGPALFGSLDQALGHRRRFDKRAVDAMLTEAGLRMTRSALVQSRLDARVVALFARFGSRAVPKPILKAFDKTVWLWRWLDPVLPWTGTSLLAVGSKPAQEIIIEEVQLRRSEQHSWQKP